MRSKNDFPHCLLTSSECIIFFRLFHILNPKYQGEDCTPKECTLGVPYIVEVSESLKIGQNPQVFESLSKCTLREDHWILQSVWDTKIANPRVWWDGTYGWGGGQALSITACAILAMNPYLNIREEHLKPLDAATIEKMNFTAYSSTL